MDRKEDRKYNWYVCGKCGHEIYHLKTEEETIPCNECGAIYEAASGDAITGGTLRKIKGWMHRDRKQHDIPPEIKLDLANPNG